MKSFLPKTFSPNDYEEDIYYQWESSGYFNPDNLPGQRKKSFSIILPPPNVTGKLHIGHAAMLAYQDIIIRYHRLKGDKTLWLPGMDHAAIATQNVVEKELRQQGLRRQNLGRPQFLQRVDEFTGKARQIIRHQLKKMGSSLDWSREKFTLDADLSKMVRYVFKKMYDDGLIYRGDRVVNWCPTCHSTLADDEVEYKEVLSKLYYIKYGPITVATTRPETKLGDTGVAVHSHDKRYQDLIGRKLEIDLAGHKIKVKVFADRAVDAGFGTGAIGVTPAHSQQDFLWAEKNKLPLIKIINEDGRMTAAAGKYHNLAVADCRQQFVTDLTAAGLIAKVEDYSNNLSCCYRCGSVIEQLPSLQWFVAVNKKIPGRSQSLKELASQAVKKGKINIIPPRFAKTYFQWMDNLRDWCISRQIWYGHRIPVWYKKNSSEEILVPHNIIELVLLRHGTTDWNKEKKIQGRSDVPLDEQSIDQIKKIIPRLKQEQFDLIITSPLMRARQTAEIINQELKLGLATEDSIKERDYGEFEGQSIEQVKKEHPDYFKNKIDYDIPGEGEESYEQITRRVKKFLQQLSQHYPNKKILVVCHLTVMRTLKMIIDGGTKAELSSYTPAFSELIRYQILDGNYQLKDWQQDQDTLDTWFSSALWSFSTLGWPQKTADLKAYHPTTVMETGYDILFFWVARMIMMSTYLLKEVPFETVYLHGLVRTKEGEKMSKSKPETCVDPLEMISQFGADALRLAMVMGAAPGSDVRLYQEKIAGYRNFVNKLWNIGRYILSQTPEVRRVVPEPPVQTLADRWILEELGNTINLVTQNIEDYQFSLAGEKLYEFTWNKLADWYLETAKLEGDKEDILLYLLERLLILWQPFCPFVTEVLWQEFKGEDLLLIQNWPKATTALKPKAVGRIQKDFSFIQGIIAAIRNIRAENKIDPKKIYGCVIKSQNDQLVQENKSVIEGLARVKINANGAGLKIYLAEAEIVLDIKENGELKKQRQKEIVNLNRYIEIQQQKLANKNFINKAPAAVVEQERAKLTQAQQQLKKLLDH